MSEVDTETANKAGLGVPHSRAQNPVPRLCQSNATGPRGGTVLHKRSPVAHLSEKWVSRASDWAGPSLAIPPSRDQCFANLRRAPAATDARCARMGSPAGRCKSMLLVRMFRA